MGTKLTGLWGFPLTPFCGGSVDRKSLATGVSFLVSGGADVVCAAGALGQGERLLADERLRCVEVAVDAAAGRVPVVAALPASEQIGDAARGALAAGATAILLVPIEGEPADLGHAIRAIGAATHERMPVVLYNRGPLRLEPGELRDLAESPIIIGLKDGHGDLRQFRRLHEALGSRLTWVGAYEDLALGYWAYGADAVAPASLLFAPEYARRWWSALGRQDRDEAARLLRAFAWPMTDLRLSRPNIDVAVVREFSTEFALPVGDLRPPAEPLTDSERAEVRRLARVLRSELAVPPCRLHGSEERGLYADE